MLVNSCANKRPEPVPIEDSLATRGYVLGDQTRRISDDRINGWSSVDRYSVIINVGASMNYLVTLRSPCDGLRSARSLAFSTTIGNLTDKDKLLVRSSGGFLEHCLIDTIHILDKAGKEAEA